MWALVLKGCLVALTSCFSAGVHTASPYVDQNDFSDCIIADYCSHLDMLTTANHFAGTHLLNTKSVPSGTSRPALEPFLWHSVVHQCRIEAGNLAGRPCFLICLSFRQRDGRLTNLSIHFTKALVAGMSRISEQDGGAIVTILPERRGCFPSVSPRHKLLETIAESVRVGLTARWSSRS